MSNIIERLVVLCCNLIFCNRKILAEDPGIEDLARTALELFGVPPPPYMEGKSLFERPAKEAAA